MGVTITANGLTISHKGSGGLEMCSIPDICKTPSPGGPVPIPYFIISKSSSLTGGTKKVKADGGNSIDHKSSKHARCNGDEPGTAGGIISGVNMKASTWITYSMNVKVEGKNIARLSDKMFMNNKNTISGVGGHLEMPLYSGPDPVMKALCKIFCEAREEWLNCKPPPTCPSPSAIAEKKTKAQLGKRGSALTKALKGKLGAAERTFYTIADKSFEGARKVYTKSGLQRAVKRQLDKAVKKKIVMKGAKMAAKGWMKLVPGLNVISTIYDVVDTGLMAKDIYDMMKASDAFVDNAIKVKPDFAVIGPDGAPEAIYDFKFDRPETGYQDGWQKGQMQEQAYELASGGKAPKKVDQKTCKCTK